jgi:hypothetical protein
MEPSCRRRRGGPGGCGVGMWKGRGERVRSPGRSWKCSARRPITGSTRHSPGSTRRSPRSVMRKKKATVSTSSMVIGPRSTTGTVVGGTRRRIEEGARPKLRNRCGPYLNSGSASMQPAAGVVLVLQQEEVRERMFWSVRGERERLGFFFALNIQLCVCKFGIVLELPDQMTKGFIVLIALKRLFHEHARKVFDKMLVST